LINHAKAQELARIERALAALNNPIGLEGALRRGAEEIRTEAIQNIDDHLFDRQDLQNIAALTPTLIVAPGPAPLSYEIKASFAAASSVENGSQEQTDLSWLRLSIAKILPSVKRRLGKIILAASGAMR